MKECISLCREASKLFRDIHSQHPHARSQAKCKETELRLCADDAENYLHLQEELKGAMKDG